MKNWSEVFLQKLLAAETFSAALLLFFPNDQKTVAWAFPKPLSYSEVSRKLGLKSRSHVREIVLGKKVAPKNFVHLFCQSLKIAPHWERYLDLLRRAESDEKFKTALALQRARLQKSLRKKELPGPTAMAQSSLNEPEIPAIFAALGDDSGATLEEITKRSRVEAARASFCLRALVACGAVEEREGRFVAMSPHLIFSGLGEEEYFRRDLLRSLDRARAETKKADCAQKLFFNSTLCVRSQDLPELKKELKELLTRYVGSAESAQGDQVVHLVTALT